MFSFQTKVDTMTEREILIYFRVGRKGRTKSMNPLGNVIDNFSNSVTGAKLEIPTGRS